jgi:hypothetical protein
MLGASALSEYSISDQAILLAGVSEMSGIASSANAGVGIMSGVSSMSSTATQTSTGMFISAGANADLDFNFTETSVGTRVRLADATLEPQFEVGTDANFTASASVSKTTVFTQTTEGAILYINIQPADNETYTTINPSGDEIWTEIEV